MAEAPSPKKAAAQTPRDLVLAASNALFRDFDASAAQALLAPDYIQHNPGVPTGAAPVLGFIPALEESGLELTTHRVLAQGDFVVTHGTYKNAQAFGAPTLVGFDVFRVEDGKVAEHWDNLQPPGPPNPSGRTMVDGPTKVVDRDQTAANEALVRSFVKTVLQDGEGARAAEFVSTESYHQHNPGIGDGLDGLGQALAAMAKQGITMVYTRTPLVVAEGNFVFTGSEGTLGGKPTAFYDLFRVEKGKIVEHWDVMADIPEKMAHSNGKF